QEILSLNNQVQARGEGDNSSKLHARLVKARLNYETFVNSLYAAHPDLKVQRGQPNILTLDKAGNLIEDKAAWLDFVVMDDKAYLFVLSKDERGNGEKGKIIFKSYP